MTELKSRKTKHNSLIQDSDIFWFIDDLTALIDGGKFEKVHYGNYPPEFELKRQNSSENKISLRSWLKKLSAKIFSQSLWYERLRSNFSHENEVSVCNTPSKKDFTLHLKLKFLKLQGTLLHLESFKSSCTKKMPRMLKQEGSTSRIKQNIVKFMNTILNRNYKRNLDHFDLYFLTF